MAAWVYRAWTEARDYSYALPENASCALRSALAAKFQENKLTGSSVRAQGFEDKKHLPGALRNLGIEKTVLVVHDHRTGT